MKLRSFFTVFAVFYWLILVVISIYFVQIYTINLATIGMMLTGLLPIGFFYGLNLATQPRTSPRQILLTLFILLNSLLALTKYKEFGVFIILLYFGGFVTWLLYLYWYSYLDIQESSVLKLGNTLPDLTFSTYDNHPFYSSSLLGKKVVYVFYRGNWCPVDMAQIKELCKQYDYIQTLGGEIVLVSPQPHSESKKLAELNKIDFRFLTDDENKMACLLEIENKYGVPKGIGMSKYDVDTVYPTVIITDELGKIIYLDQTDNYRIRPAPEQYMEVLKS